MSVKTRKTRAAKTARRKSTPRKIFEVRAPDLPNETDLITIQMTKGQQISANLWVVYLRGTPYFGGGDRWQLAIVPTELIKAPEWTAAEPTVLETIANLIRLQGSDPDRYAVSIMAQFEEWKGLKKQQYGYGWLAMDQEFNALALARMAYYDESVSPERRELALEHLTYLLRIFAIKKPEQVRKWLNDAREAFGKLGKLPWTPLKSPITEDKAREAWKQHHGHVIYGQHNYTQYADFIDSMLESEGHWEAIAEKLKTEYPNQYQAYIGRLQERIRRIRRLRKTQSFPSDLR